ncbi:DnaB-like helicase C-terminal domain-containing protein [Anaerotruncus colihominis]|uniref:DnaB-like helicase C-terminal domain-containing protein n=1 Tax=Anaerotruncus colihominis TaxID=169435 RepID=UPI002430C553|nr:DnaB-like helicase C-terminal domain-containing protein [Anaerotruncus colihominis]
MQWDERFLNELRALLPEYMAQKRIVVGTRGKKLIHCINPEHRDRTPSMSYHPQSRRLHCFGCGANYDLFDVIAMDYPDCDSFPRQVKKACELFCIPLPDNAPASKHGVRAVRPAAARPAPPARLTADYTDMVRAAVAEHGAGGSYFTARGIPRALCERYSLYEAGGRAWMPVFLDGKCTCYCARAASDNITPRYKNSPGAMDIFNAGYLTGEGKGGALFIAEAILDALSIEACGYRAVALCGAANVGKFLSLCAAHPAAAAGYTLVAAGDMDAAGERMNRSLKEGLEALGLSCAVLQLPGGAKDANELLLSDRAALARALAESAGAEQAAYAAESAARSLEALLDASLRRASRRACPTGFAALDDALDGGLYAGLYIIGAISSLGKTSFVLQIADYIAAHETDVLFFSLEMSKFELMAKSLSRLTYQLDAPAGHMRAFTARQVLRVDPDMPLEKSMLLNEALGEYRTAAEGLFIWEGLADIGAREIRERVQKHIQIRGCKPVVVIDYLQILKPDDPRATDKQNTDRAVVELKRISRDFDLPVLAISSFNRENYRNAVSMEAFKESGAVEYSSDVLLGLQLAGAGEAGFDVNAAKARSPRAVELVMLKNRNGIPYAKIEYAYAARFSYFGEGRVSHKP